MRFEAVYEGEINQAKIKMKTYKVTIIADKWPSDFTLEATDWTAAINRAVREWKRSTGKNSRTETLSIKAIKFDVSLKASEKINIKKW